MLFNSSVFIYVFLPVVVIGFYGLGRLSHGKTTPKLFLLAASFFFYGWWNVVYVPLLMASIFINYYLGRRMIGVPVHKKAILLLGISLNLSFLAYFKYFNFFIDNLNFLVDGSIVVGKIILPLGISFYTFQQMSYLLDSYRAKAGEETLLDYALFVAVFPHLIAGPITTHREISPQFKQSIFGEFKNTDLIVGSVLFFIGLFKKAVIADNLSAHSLPVFEAAKFGNTLDFTRAWGGALSYTFQLYFDFSGYSDMAIGLGRMLGLRLPMNFYSPFKSKSIIEFWRRWHATLGRFVGTEVFLPLSVKFTRIAMAQKKRPVGFFLMASAVPTVITFVLVGLWHGAAWTFIVFGLMHGLYLVINHGWRTLKSKHKSLSLPPVLCWGITFLAIIISFVIFRAENLSSGFLMLGSMFSPHGDLLLQGLSEFSKNSLDITKWLLFHKFGYEQCLILAVVISFTLPNTMQLMSQYDPCIDISGMRMETLLSKLHWAPNRWGLVFALTVSVVALLNITGTTEFLYFQF